MSSLSLVVPLPLNPDWPAPGRLIELSNPGVGACFSTAAALVRQVQEQRRLAAWLQFEGGPLYPPDLYESGVHLAELIVVQVPRAHGCAGLLRAGELLLQSGAIALCIFDLQKQNDLSLASQSRLFNLARKGQSSVVFISTKSSAAFSQSSLVSLRLEPKTRRLYPGLFHIDLHCLKNKVGLSLPSLAPLRGPLGFF